MRTVEELPARTLVIPLLEGGVVRGGREGVVRREGGRCGEGREGGGVERGGREGVW